MRVIYFGTPQFAVPTLEAIVAAGHDVPLVVSRPDMPAGRGMKLSTPPVVDAARTLGLALTQPEKIGRDEFFHRIRVLHADVAVVVAYGKLIPSRLLELPQLGFVNLHPSLLPRHRGPAPIEWAIFHGDEETGLSTMILDQGMDTGPVLLQRRVPVGPREHAWTLEDRLAPMGAELVVETLAGLADGSVIPKPQDESLATVNPKLQRRLGRIQWDQPADAIARSCRAFDPWPGLYCNFRGARVKVHGVEAGNAEPGTQEPGTVISVSSAGVAVRCGEGTVAMLTELQREGKRRLPADAFIIGERVAPGESFR